MITSGPTALSTSGDSAITALAIAGSAVFQEIQIVNTGSVSGLYSIDGGESWTLLPGPGSITLRGAIEVTASILAKRFPATTDLSGIWACAH